MTFYAAVTPAAVAADPDRANVLRQALAGMLWTKQYFYYDLDAVAREHGAGAHLPQHERRVVRNGEWSHMHNDDIISMPDKWEYPWYAAWDLAFHMIPLGMVDLDFAKHQLDLMLRNDYLHPNGQLPAYEWNFGDVNPPVHAWATMQLYVMDKERRDGAGDIEFLKYAFSKLLVNFTWWVNRKDRTGANVFEGGFLGLDNIGVFDRSRRCPPAATSTRPTAPPGWCSSASRCCASPSSWRCTSRCTRSSSRSSSSTRCSLPARWTAWAIATTRCGMKKTASSTTCCACPTARRRG